MVCTSNGVVKFTWKETPCFLGNYYSVDTQWIVFAAILLFNTVVSLLIAVLLRRRPSAPGLNALILMLCMLALWNFGYAMITLVASLEAKRFWLRVENIGILLTPIFWFLFTIQYTRRDKWLNKLTGGLFFIIPSITLLFIWSDRWFHFHYASIQPFSVSGGPLVIERGWWYAVANTHAYLINIACILLLIWQAIQYRNIYRRQMFALVGAVLIPVLVNVVYQLAPSFDAPDALRVDLTPISFTISTGLIAFGVFGLRIFDLIPIARYTVLEHIPEMVFVVDAQDRVLDANSAAQRILNKPMSSILGRSPLDVFQDWPELLSRFQSGEDTREEIQLPGQPSRTVELAISTLYNPLGAPEGRVIVAHDITEHKWLENDLQHANSVLKSQLTEIEELRVKLQEQAIRDPLTNAFNRRHMSEFLDKEIIRGTRENYPVSVAIMDMDFFKQFNDSYGHKCGDAVLQAFASFLFTHIRRSDVVCRYGGEEFVILMPRATLETCCKRVEAWRKEFSESAIDYDSRKLSATFSAGVASFPLHGLTGDSILQAADQALYQSKGAGRNCVTMFGTVE